MTKIEIITFHDYSQTRQGGFQLRPLYSVYFIYACLKVRKNRKQTLPQKQCQNEREKSLKHLIG